MTPPIFSYTDIFCPKYKYPYHIGLSAIFVLHKVYILMNGMNGTTEWMMIKATLIKALLTSHRRDFIFKVSLFLQATGPTIPSQNPLYSSHHVK